MNHNVYCLLATSVSFHDQYQKLQAKGLHSSDYGLTALFMHMLENKKIKSEQLLPVTFNCEMSSFRTYNFVKKN
jgi:hypothetical protein